MKLWGTMTWGEIKLFLREPLTVVFAFAFPLVMLLVLAEVFGTAPSTEPAPGGELPWRGMPPLSAYVPGYIALAAAAVGLIMIPAHLASYRERGVLRRFRAASIPASTVFAAQVAVEVVRRRSAGCSWSPRPTPATTSPLHRTGWGRSSGSSSASPPSPPSACSSAR